MVFLPGIILEGSFEEIMYVVINYSTKHAILLVVRERVHTSRGGRMLLASVLDITYPLSAHVTAELFSEQHVDCSSTISGQLRLLN